MLIRYLCASAVSARCAFVYCYDHSLVDAGRSLVRAYFLPAILQSGGEDEHSASPFPDKLNLSRELAVRSLEEVARVMGIPYYRELYAECMCALIAHRKPSCRP